MNFKRFLPVVYSRIVWNGILFFSRFALVATLLASLIVSFGLRVPQFELIYPFPLLYLTIGIIGLIIFLIRAELRFCIFAAAIVLLNTLLLKPYVKISSTNPLTQKDTEFALNVLNMNINTANSRFDDTLAIVRKVDPTILVLLEVNDRWIEQLSSLQQNYRYTLLLPRANNFGVALYSKIPFKDISDKRLQYVSRPAIDVELDLQETTVRLIGIHSLPPTSKPRVAQRDILLRNTADVVAESNGPTIVVGDFNISMWSPAFKDFMQRSALINPRIGRGVFPTWPAHILALTPIDHILVSQEFAIHSLESVPIPGSDHLGMYARLTLPH